LSLTTRGVTNIDVSWTGGTVTTNSRPYAIRLQWRLGTNAAFPDVLDGAGHPVEYQRNPNAGHSERLGPVRLPPSASDQLVVQLRWKYYAIESDATGPRAELRVDDIRV